MTLDQARKLNEIRATLEVMLVDLEQVAETLEDILND